MLKNRSIMRNDEKEYNNALKADEIKNLAKGYALFSEEGGARWGAMKMGRYKDEQFEKAMVELKHKLYPFSKAVGKESVGLGSVLIGDIIRKVEETYYK